jgi:predicted transcriptional regulator
MRTTTPKTSVPIRMSEEDKERLDALAAATGRSRSHHLTEAVRRYIAEENWQLEKISQGLAEADREEFADDAEIEAEMRGIIADARAKRDARAS